MRSCSQVSFTRQVDALSHFIFVAMIFPLLVYVNPSLPEPLGTNFLRGVQFILYGVFISENPDEVGRLLADSKMSF